MTIPRKRFGQHFLCDQSVIHRIVASLGPEKDDHLLEIGPGQGALTIPVLRKVKQLEVVELDRDLIPELQRRSEPVGVLHIHSADALTFNFAAIKKDIRQLRVFGNLPYNISTPLIFHLLTFTPIISDMLFMLQREVAERLAAEVSSEAYGRLSIMVQYHCHVDLLFDVPPEAFYPPPKVYSSILRMLPHHELPYPAQDYGLFEKMVKQAFGQRRKTLRNSLKELVGKDSFEATGISDQLRPEDLSVKEFVALSNAVKNLQG